MMTYPLLTVSIVTVVVALFAVITVAMGRRRTRVWRRFAAIHGLEYEEAETGPAVRGTLDGRDFEMAVKERGSDTQALGVHVVRTSVAVDGAPQGLEVSSAPGMIGSLQKSLEPETVEAGDKEFDQVALLKAPSEHAVAAYLTPKRKRSIQSLIQEHSPHHVTIKDRRLTVESREMFSRFEQLEERSRSLIRGAELLDRPEGR